MSYRLGSARMGDMLTEKQSAAHVGLSVAAFRAAIRRGDAPPGQSKTPNGWKRWSVADLLPLELAAMLAKVPQKRARKPTVKAKLAGNESQPADAGGAGKRISIDAKISRKERSMTIDNLKTEILRTRFAQNGARIAELSARVDALPDKKSTPPSGPHAFSATKSAGLILHEQVLAMRHEQPGLAYSTALARVLANPGNADLKAAYAGETDRSQLACFDDGSAYADYAPKW